MIRKKTLCKIGLILGLNGEMANLRGDELDDFLQGADGGNLDLSAFDDPTAELSDPAAEDFEVVDTFVEKEREFEQQSLGGGEGGARSLLEFWEPKMFSVLIRPGVILTDLDNGQAFEVKKAFYAKAREKSIGREISHILNRKGEARYRAKTSELVNIEEDIKLLPQLDALEVYQGQNDFGSINHTFPLDFFFNYHFESVVSEYYPALFGLSSNRGLAHRFQLKSYYRSPRLPIHLGINLQYISGGWSDPNINFFTWNALFLGPNIYASFQGRNGLRWLFHAGVGEALSHHSRRDLEQHSYSSTTMQFDLEASKQTAYGTLALGTGFRRTLFSLKESTEPLIVPVTSNSVNALSISLGYSYSWNP